jgi:hypothetical protein
MRYLAGTSILFAAVTFAGCESVGAPDANLTVKGSAGAPPEVQMSVAHTPRPSFNMAQVTTGDPASVNIGMYALWISQHTDCSSPVLVQDYGNTPEVKNLVANPVLFSGSPATGSYPCVVIKMSDVIGFTSATTFGTCEAGTVYTQDIYRDGETDWKDVDLNSITGHGSDEVPVNDGVTIVLTTDTAAAIGRGFSGNQVVQLASALPVPSSSTFYWNGEGSVTTADGWPCGLMRGRPTFH